MLVKSNFVQILPEKRDGCEVTTTPNELKTLLCPLVSLPSGSISHWWQLPPVCPVPFSSLSVSYYWSCGKRMFTMHILHSLSENRKFLLRAR